MKGKKLTDFNYIILLVVLNIFLVNNNSFFIRCPSANADYLAGMTSYWRFDEGSGDIAADSSGNGYNGTINGATWTTGLIDGALDFDSVDDYVEIALSTDFDSGQAGQMTFSAFIKSDDYSKKQVILSRRHFCNNEGHFNIYVYAHRVYFSFHSDYDEVTRFLYSRGILQNGKAYRIFWLKKWNETGTRLLI